MPECRKKRKKILLAVGGTGGHLFPAQALANELTEFEVLFAGCLLSTNRYFQKDQFPFVEVRGGSPLKRGVMQKARALFQIGVGLKESLKLLNTFKPDLVVGFGSFHSFPVLLAARLKKVPYLLFESNAIPGKVNRLFSAKALTSALQFPEAGRFLKGKTELVQMPFWGKSSTPSRMEALAYFNLDPKKQTLLVFGGSQGADALNRIICNLKLPDSFQIIHLTGSPAMATFALQTYSKHGILSCVKPFEEKMQLAWAAADVVICRSGGATIAELINYEVPAILIPWPGAADNHQEKNAQSLATACNGIISLCENQLDQLQSILSKAIPRLESMKKEIALFKKSERRQQLSKLILNHI